MKNQGIILHGSDDKMNIETAYKMAIQYMEIDPINERYVTSNTYPNFLFIKKDDDKNEISIDDSRHIIEFLSQKPTLPGKRSVIIENFENMSRNAANSILKILEEPPVDSIIIITTCKLLSILPTIRSRCIKVRVISENQNISEFNDPVNYIKASLKNIDPNFIEKTVDFIKSNCSNSQEFAKLYSDNNPDDFFNIAIAYNGYLVAKTPDIKTANKIFSLQNLFSLSKNTYPDKQNLIIAASYIAKHQ